MEMKKGLKYVLLSIGAVVTGFVVYSILKCNAEKPDMITKSNNKKENAPPSHIISGKKFIRLRKEAIKEKSGTKFEVSSNVTIPSISVKPKNEGDERNSEGTG